MPFNLGPLEMVLVLVVMLVLFGAKRLPELGQGLGRGIREFKRSVSDISGELAAPADRSLAGRMESPAFAGRSSAELVQSPTLRAPAETQATDI